MSETKEIAAAVIQVLAAEVEEQLEQEPIEVFYRLPGRYRIYLHREASLAELEELDADGEMLRPLLSVQWNGGRMSPGVLDTINTFEGCARSLGMCCSNVSQQRLTELVRMAAVFAAAVGQVPSDVVVYDLVRNPPEWERSEARHPANPTMYEQS